MAESKLKGHRIALLATDGFEQVELTAPMRALKRHGAEVEILSLHSGSIRGNNLHLPGKKVKVDGLVAKADPARYDGLLIPGGFVNPDFLRANQDALHFVTAMSQAKKPIATLCHGPWVLASAGLLSGRQITSWPSIKDDLKNAGAEWRDEELVRDGNLITSRGPHDLLAFERAMVSLFAESKPQSGAAPEKKSSKGWVAAAITAGVAALGAAAFLLRRLK
jgi:protease I